MKMVNLLKEGEYVLWYYMWMLSKFGVGDKGRYF